MDKLSFTCTTITPLAMNGAYGDRPELRPPGIKAALRFWWRALNGHLELAELRTMEGQIFGNTGQRSRVVIRVDHNAPPMRIIKTPLVPHKDAKKGKIHAFAHQQPFTVNLSLTNAEYITLEALKNLFILSCTLGGWGKRSRRGFGSVGVETIKLNEIKLDYTQPQSLDDIFKLLPQSYFKKTEGYIQSNFKKNNDYPYLKKIEIGPGFDSPMSLLTSIGSSSSKAKSENDDSWDYKNSMGHTSKRFASPLYVSVLKIKDNFHPVFSTLNIALQDNRNRISPEKSSNIQNSFKNRITP